MSFMASLKEKLSPSKTKSSLTTANYVPESGKKKADEVGSNGAAIGSAEADVYAESIEWWMNSSKANKERADELQQQLDRIPLTQEGLGRGVGRNKQSMWKADPSNHSNINQLKVSTKQTIWPTNKFLKFKGSKWLVYDASDPHPFAAHVMRQVVVPPSFRGAESDYYTNVALPTVAAKLSSLRGNFNTSCGKAFKKLHHTRPTFGLNVRQAFATLMSYNDNWNSLPDDDLALEQLNTLIYFYASELYGRNEIRQWQKANQDKSVLDRLNANDLAYALVVYENYHLRWIYDLQSARAKEQQAQQDQDDSAEEVAEPARKKTKASSSTSDAPASSASDAPVLPYTKLPTAKKTYLEIGWNRDGIRRFKALRLSLQQLIRNDDTWQACKVAWDEFISNKKQVGEGCWVLQYSRQNYLEESDDEEDDISEGDAFEFELPVGGMGELKVPGV